MGLKHLHDFGNAFSETEGVQCQLHREGRRLLTHLHFENFVRQSVKMKEKAAAPGYTTTVVLTHLIWFKLDQLNGDWQIQEVPLARPPPPIPRVQILLF